MASQPPKQLSAMVLTGKHWLGAPRAESIFILAPPLLSVLIVLLFRDYFTSHELSTFWWVLLVLSIDVSHVYSTLFRMYWDKETFRQNRKLLVTIPFISLVLGVALYSYSDLIFWRLLAYVAVFHFVRQQYGFMRLYSRKEKTLIYKFVDSLAIYSATIYPILHWHLNLTAKLSWFVAGDFIAFHNPLISDLLWWTYLVILAVYVGKEVLVSIITREVNIPRNLIIAGTYLSWYVGIVAFQADLLFTLVNVVSHGIPYMGLIWIYGEKKLRADFSFTAKGAIIFVSVLLLLAYTEEFFWDVFVWGDHPEIFPALAATIQSPGLLAMLVPLLVLPQITHYVLDGFIWKFSQTAHHPGISNSQNYAP
jgi:hypothetical protein